jgi:hypothetical protein
MRPKMDKNWVRNAQNNAKKREIRVSNAENMRKNSEKSDFIHFGLNLASIVRKQRKNRETAQKPGQETIISCGRHRVNAYSRDAPWPRTEKRNH